MRIWRKIGFVLLAATIAAPALADYGGRGGRRHFGHAHGSRGWTHWNHHRPHGWHPHRFARGYYLRCAYPHSHYSLSFGYPLASSGYYVGRPDYAANGLWLGALAGAVIGNNSGGLGHSAWRGAALGGLAGYVAGSMAEQRARSREEAAEASHVAIEPEVPAPEPVASRRVTGGAAEAPAKPSRMAEANRLFGRY